MAHAKDLRKEDESKLLETLQKKQTELADIKLKASTGIQKDISIMNKMKKDIARIITILKEKEVLNEG